ncbi:hypothetical protein AB7783_06895 [Tardiphaga sp. 172_B4_N1_3]|uniref:hypothetical protein n=1 Tax=Tardiphaga sp. 172_B4_N1_3 TaxID=3240787 RepID=UPI003F8ACA8E
MNFEVAQRRFMNPAERCVVADERSSFLEELKPFGRELRTSIEAWMDLKEQTLSGEGGQNSLSEVKDGVLVCLDAFLSHGREERAWLPIASDFVKTEFARECLGHAAVTTARIGSREFIEPFCAAPGTFSPDARRARRLDAYNALVRFVVDFNKEILAQNKIVVRLANP